MFSGNRSVADYVFLGIMLLLTAAGLWEFYGMVEARGMVCFRYAGLAGGLLLVGVTFFYFSGRFGPHAAPAKANDFETSLLIVLVLGLCVRQFLARRNPRGLEAISTTLFGIMYVPWLLNFIAKIDFFPKADGNGHYYVLFFILVTKFSDMGAYVVGSLIGRHKMIPRVSPGKTWEGFGGALLFSTGASLGFAALAGTRLVGMTPTHAVVLGLVLGGGAVVGDLVESLFKREAGVKDSGRLFPGIGGILDLLDSLLFTAPLMYSYLRHILTH
jgi:phosphatidate cytidylyltransferase